MADEAGKKKPKKFSDIIDQVKDNVEDLSQTVRHSTLGHRLHDRRWSIQEGFENNFKGYCDADIVNLGDRLVEHYAELLGYLADQEYDVDDADEYKVKLKAVSENFACYCTIVEEVGDLGRIENIGSGSNPYASPLLNDPIESMNAKFSEDWEWVGNNILCEDFRMPSDHAADKSDTTPHVQSYYDSIAKKAGKAATALRNATERAFSQNRFSRRDISQMPGSELKRTSEMLYQFANSSFGCPYNYCKEHVGLKTRDEDWNDRQAITASIMGNPSVTKDFINISLGDGSSTIAKNSVDADYNAWTEDVVYAAEVIGVWHDWIGNLKANMKTAGAEDAQIDGIEKILKAEFLRTWEWIGQNIFALWI